MEQNNSESPVQPAPVAEPKKSKGMLFGMIICLVLGAAGVGFGIYGMMQANKANAPAPAEDNTNDNTDDNTNDNANDGPVALIDQLKAAYTAATGLSSENIRIDGSEVKNSLITPYQTIWTYNTGAAALFYRTNPNYEWKYFTASQSVLDCSEYNTDEIKNAYAGETCNLDGFNEDGSSRRSVVKPTLKASVEDGNFILKNSDGGVVAKYDEAAIVSVESCDAGTIESAAPLKCSVVASPNAKAWFTYDYTTGELKFGTE